MNIEPKSKLYWILQNVLPGAWSYPSNFCQLCRQLVGVTVIGVLLTVAACFELSAMTFFVLEMINGPGPTIIVEGEEVVLLWMTGYLGVATWFGTTLLLFGFFGWVITAIISFIVALAVIADSAWYRNLRTLYNDWRWGRTTRAEERKATRVLRTSGFWYLVGVYVDSVHKRICPLVTYNETEKTTT